MIILSTGSTQNNFPVGRVVTMKIAYLDAFTYLLIRMSYFVKIYVQRESCIPNKKKTKITFARSAVHEII